ncbi:CubicO group peptidase, beta-lactamase class C family [Catalinimonas alkaloidigena]|uniref:CubicO group peptidase, beta-lactamase class C family n=1 Tax=Catalinimonas alkaloidigena TaxID=1075417 RepID=A0A1G9DG74_9BACT|nr:serine hydrolase [Catalinimonas alkaloidigena]SDK62868.1 CubicO group peptidase, beta-lactamase class C family [Catalinimonas alkaloidigena]
MRYSIWLFLIACIPTGLFAQKNPLKGLDRYVDEARQAWEIPGMALTIVKDGKVVYAQGFGVRNLDTREPVDAHTLFSNASTTKAFVATALLMLSDEGKVDLDAPVIRYLPGFRVADPYVTRALMVRDLLSHRTGVEPTNLWVYDSLDLSDDYVRRLQFAPQHSSLRSHYQYNNDMFIVAGKVIEAVTGQPWETYVQQRILTPLGMAETLTNGLEVKGKPNVAAAHGPIHDTLRVLAYPYNPGVSAAGALRSNIHDMARWVIALLDSTRHDGTRLLTPGAYAQLFTPHTLIGQSSNPAIRRAGIHFYAYGLGWFLQDYRGHLLVFHTGSLRGASALVGMLPEENLGFAMFLNKDQAELRIPLMYEIFDRYLGTQGIDWSGEALAYYQAEAAKEHQEALAVLPRVPHDVPSLAAEAYAGTYVDSLYGTLTVTLVGGALQMQRGERSYDLQHVHYDTFRAVNQDPWYGQWPSQLRFLMDEKGRVVQLEMDEVRYHRLPTGNAGGTR